MPARIEADCRPDYRGGLSYMRYSVSDTAEQGLLAAQGSLLKDPRGNAKILSEIRDGSLRKKWIEETKRAAPTFWQAAPRTNPSGRTIGSQASRMMPFPPVVAPGLATKQQLQRNSRIPLVTFSLIAVAR